VAADLPLIGATAGRDADRLAPEQAGALALGIRTSTAFGRNLVESYSAL
jgi:hypothetical protein